MRGSCWLLAIGYWLLAVGCWLLAVGFLGITFNNSASLNDTEYYVSFFVIICSVFRVVCLFSAPFCGQNAVTNEGKYNIQTYRFSFKHEAMQGVRCHTEILANEGFVVMPYMYPDLNAARDMVNAGAATIMPLASPIGSNKGLATKEFIQILIDEIDLPIIVDAGIGRPSQACEAMEMGAAAIMANTALATAGDLPLMASSFRQAIEAGRKAYLSGLGRVLTRGASASDPLTGFLRD